MSIVAGPTETPTSGPAWDPVLTSAGAITGYIFGTLAVLIILLCTCIIIRRCRWRPARKYIKRQSERTIGMGPKLNDDQNGVKRGKGGALSLKHLSNGSSANSNGKIKPPKKAKPLAQAIKMERLNVRREAKERKQVVKEARKALKRGEKPPLENVLGLHKPSSSRPPSAPTKRNNSKPESAAPSRTYGLKKGVSDRNLELPSLNPITNGMRVPKIEVTEENEVSPRESRQNTFECEVYVHSARAGSSLSNDSDSVSVTSDSRSKNKRPSNGSRPGSGASSRLESAQSRERLSPRKPNSGRGMHNSASSPALLTMERSKSPIHSIIVDHSDIEEAGEDNYVFNLNTADS